jgi:hypothetical protein
MVVGQDTPQLCVSGGWDLGFDLGQGDASRDEQGKLGWRDPANETMLLPEAELLEVGRC